MSDLVAGLVGVVVGALLTAGTSVYMARRREERDARAARRIIHSELKEAAKAVDEALEHGEWPTGWTKKTWSESWSMYRPTLALAIRDDEEFDKIATAYLDMGLLETGLAADKRAFVETDLPFLNHVSSQLTDAIAAISRSSASAPLVDVGNRDDQGGS